MRCFAPGDRHAGELDSKPAEEHAMDLIMVVLAWRIGMSMIVGALCGWLVFVLAWLIRQDRARSQNSRMLALLTR
jgi:NhaP-type Na+/H+ or K+/H+ antiporter